MKGNGLMQQKYFSIIVVSLNPGIKVIKTIESIINQTLKDYEIIIKDGYSTDDSIKELEKRGLLNESGVRFIQKKDHGIYDGMNQALKEVMGKYIYFLNCGDYLRDRNVLENIKNEIEKYQSLDKKYIFYGNQYNEMQDCVVTSAPRMNDFTCYRNVPCHQVCFYDKRLFDNRAYLQKYLVRADYEHFLYCIYKENATAIFVPIVVCSYEGGGYSESDKNRKRSEKEHREITRIYFGKKAVFYHLIMILSGAQIRTLLAGSKRFSTSYNKIKTLIYKK